jgi:hypothetical protein
MFVFFVVVTLQPSNHNYDDITSLGMKYAIFAL